MLDIKRLRLLAELSRRGTIAAVASALNLSPSAVSQQLAQLERETGVLLLRKQGRTLTLLEPAKQLVRAAEQMLHDLEAAEAALHATQQELTGSLRLAVFQTALLALVPAALLRLQRQHPKLRIEVVQHEPETGLSETAARAFDLVVAEQYPGHAAAHFSGLDRVSLLQDRIRLALPLTPEFAHVTEITAAAELPWVMEPRGAASRHWAEQACRLAGFEPDIRFETADLQAHVRLIETGNAVALLPGLVRVNAAHQMRLVDLPGDPRRQIFTATRRGAVRHPAIQAVRAELQEQSAQIMHQLQQQK